MKHGHGEEHTSLGTIYRGQWERGRKHGTGERKIAYGLTAKQVSISDYMYYCVSFYL